MSWLIFNLAKEFNKIRDSFKKRDREIKELKDLIVSKDMIKLMIENEMLKIKSELREPIRTTPRTDKRKKADKILDKAEIMSEIGSMLQKGLSTQEAYIQIVEIKSLCKKTCFFKYLKIVREQIAQTPRSDIVN